MKMKLKSKLWVWPGDAAWHFLTIKNEEALEIKQNTAGIKRGFGSVKVVARIDDEEWNTSIFPTKEGEFLLPVKRAIREKVGIRNGDLVNFELSIQM
ncbi:MAG: DUF1905 domain-containing protein [Patescibacteria group bacterium]